MHILITGGAGFIGSQLADFYLGQGYKVTVFDNLSWGKEAFIKHNYANPRFKFCKLDLLNIKELNMNLPTNIHTIFIWRLIRILCEEPTILLLILKTLLK